MSLTQTLHLDEDLDRFETDVINTETVRIVSMPNDFRASAITFVRQQLSPQLAFSDDFAFFMSLAAETASASHCWYTSAHQSIQRKRILQHTPRSLDVDASDPCQRTMNSDLAAAIADINTIRARAFGAGNNDLSETATAQEVIDAARDEFRKETACEGLWTDQLLRRGAMGEDITIRDAAGLSRHELAVLQHGIYRARL